METRRISKCAITLAYVRGCWRVCLGCGACPYRLDSRGRWTWTTPVVSAGRVDVYVSSCCGVAWMPHGPRFSRRFFWRDNA
jgi:hypothetical protein